MSTNSLSIDLQKLRERYASAEIPSCRVCGADLAPGYMGPDKSEFYCSSPEAMWLTNEKTTEQRSRARDHWRNSEVVMYPSDFGDPDVIALIDAYESLVS